MEFSRLKKSGVAVILFPAVLVNARPNQLVKYPACTVQYLLLGDSTVLVVGGLSYLYTRPKMRFNLVYNTSTSGLGRSIFCRNIPQSL